MGLEAQYSYKQFIVNSFITLVYEYVIKVQFCIIIYLLRHKNSKLLIEYYIKY